MNRLVCINQLISVMLESEQFDTSQNIHQDYKSFYNKYFLRTIQNGQRLNRSKCCYSQCNNEIRQQKKTHTKKIAKQCKPLNIDFVQVLGACVYQLRLFVTRYALNKNHIRQLALAIFFFYECRQ